MIKRIEIKSPKIKKEVKLLLISDIHKNRYIKKDNLKKLKKDLNKEFESIDYIIIPGDVIDSPRHLIKQEFVEDLTKSLKEFIDNKITYIVLGNHDITGSNINEEYSFSILNGIDNIKCLNNEDIINIDNINIQGFIPTLDYYKKHHGNKNEFKRQFEEFKTHKFNNKYYNILITHDPSSIVGLSIKNNKFIDENIDLVVTGHMHNGLVPRTIQNLMKHHGFVGPYKTLFPRYAHGTMKINNTNIIILGAVNPTIRIPIYNKIYGPDAVILTLKKDE